MEMNTPILGIEIPGKLEAAKNYSFKGRKFTNAALYKGSFFSYMKFVRSQVAPSSGLNRERFTKELTDGDDSFKGGSFGDLITDHTDFSLYENALKSLSADKVWRTVTKTFDDLNVRRRTRNEHDGELDLDKIWDSNPFMRREKRPQKVRIVRLYVDSSFSASISSDTINKFGAFIAALISLLEKNGVQVELHACYTGTGHTSDLSSDIFFRSEFTVKRADEYLPTSQILKVFSSVWYRRAIFSMIVLNAEILNKKSCTSLGSPYQFGKAWEVIEDRVHIYSVPSHQEQGQIVETLAKLISEGIKTEEKKK